MTRTEVIKTRKKLGITQKMLAKLIKKDSTFICKLENGHRKFDGDLQKQLKKGFTQARKMRKAK